MIGIFIISICGAIIVIQYGLIIKESSDSIKDTLKRFKTKLKNSVNKIKKPSRVPMKKKRAIKRSKFNKRSPEPNKIHDKEKNNMVKSVNKGTVASNTNHLRFKQRVRPNFSFTSTTINQVEKDLST